MNALTFAGENAGAVLAPTLLLPLDLVHADPDQPRKEFSTDALQALADSLKAEGQLQPILVQRSPTEPGQYQIVAGERRWRACKIAGIETVRAEVTEDIDPARIAIVQIVENLQRQDLTLLETIVGCSSLVKLMGLEAAARRLGMSAPWVSQRATLADAPPRVQSIIHTGKLEDVEVAHTLIQALEIDEDEGMELLHWASGDDEHAGRLTREKARQALKHVKDAKVRKEVRAANEAHEAAAKKAAAERAAALKAQKKAAPTAEQLPLVPPPPKHESAWDKERRERAEAWIDVEADMKRIAREAKKAISQAITETLGRVAKDFEFHLGMRDGFASYDPPKSAEQGPLKMEVRGSTTEAGLLLDAIAPDHKIQFGGHVTIDKLRQIEAILGEPLHIREYVEIKARDAGIAAARIRSIHAQRAGLLADGTRPEDPSGSAIVQSFISARIERKQGAKLKASDAYAAYAAWCEERGSAPLALNDNAYGAAWASLCIEKVRSNGIRYVGVTLKERNHDDK